MRYNYFRLSLLPHAIFPLLEASDLDPDHPTRQDYLRHLFSQRIDFEHRKRTLVYVPIGIEERSSGPLMLGRIGRFVSSIENAPPEARFEEITRPIWRAANVIIDTRGHTDGQKVAFQHHANVGRPLPIATKLIQKINEENPHSGWLIEISPVTEVQSFWEAARRHKGEITTAEFTFTTPNVLGIRSKLNKELKRMREQHNAISVTETLRNPKGNLDLEGQEVTDSLEYISKGGGKSQVEGRKGHYI